MYKTFKSRKLKTELFHISFNPNLEGYWKPKLPAGDYDESKYNDSFLFLYSEIPIKKISCSPTIDKCFQAIYANVKDMMDAHGALTFNVYQPVSRGVYV